jgi:hypothetical protein
MIIRVIVYFVYTMAISIMSDETWFVLISAPSPHHDLWLSYTLSESRYVIDTIFAPACHRFTERRICDP